MSVRTGDLPLAVGSAVVLVAAGIGLRTVRLARTQNVLDRLSSRQIPGFRAPPERIGAVVERVGGRIPGARSCLPQALAGWFLLRLHGHPAAVHVGVTRQGGRFLAHAWTVCGERVVVGDRADLEFTPLAALPLRRAVAQEN